jgi:HlyD family secretion protein
VVVAVAVLALAAAGIWYLVLQSRSARTETLGGSGIIEVTEVQVAAQQPGAVTAVNTREGSSVRVGQVLARIDDRVLREQVRAAQAGVAAARANVDGALEEDDNDAQVANARAQVRAAFAHRDIARAQHAQATVRSPLRAVVLDVAVKRGEIASVGQTLMTLGDLSRPTLVVYIPEPQIGRVKLGQKAEITTDAFPGRTFAGTVSQVAEQAEFTPTSVQTKDQRTKLVYGVTIRLTNPERMLKPGMPADAALME